MLRMVMLSLLCAFLILGCANIEDGEQEYHASQTALTDSANAAAKRAVFEGFTVEEVNTAMVGRAWGYYDCGRYAPGPFDIYMIGSKDPRFAGNLVMSYEKVGTEYILRQISSWERGQLPFETYNCKLHTIPE